MLTQNQTFGLSLQSTHENKREKKATGAGIQASLSVALSVIINEDRYG